MPPTPNPYMFARWQVNVIASTFIPRPNLQMHVGSFAPPRPKKPFQPT